MKKAMQTALLLGLALLAGCAAPGAVSPAPTPELTESPEAGATGPVDSAPWFATFRVVSGAETGELVLAANGGTSGEVCVLNTKDLPLDRPVENGELINVYYDLLLETFPAQFGNVSAVEHTRTERDDRCGLYLQVLEDLWAVDEGLNRDITELGVDLSSVTDLSESEKSAVAWAFGNAHGLTPVEGAWDELKEQGYFTAQPLEGDGAPEGAAFYHWEDGALFSIRTNEDAAWSLPDIAEGDQPPVLTAFNAQKWRSGLGAYFFQDCTAVQADDGTWTYTVGSEAIS